MTFLSWNIHGLYKKLDDSDFLNYLYSFHVVCLTETYITDFMTLSWLTGYRLFFAPAVKLSTHGRHSGGVCVCVRQHIANKCVELKTEMNNIVCLKFHRSVFNLPNDLFLVCIYVPPVNSPFYDRSTDSRCLIDGLESLLLDNWSDMSTSHVLLCGDFNARTSNENNPIYEDRDEFGNDDVYTDVDNAPVDQRVSHDSVVNRFGHVLLKLCYICRLFIMNGRVEGDRGGEFTFFGENGSSVVDYFLASVDLFEFVEKLNVGDRPDSDHFPLELSFTFPCKHLSNRKIDCVVSPSFSKFVWDASKQDEFITFLKESLDVHKESIFSKLETSLEEGIDNFIKCIIDSASCMRRQFRQGDLNSKPKFNKECNVARSESRKALGRFRRCRTEQNRRSYCKIRNKYKCACRAFKRGVQKSRLSRLNSTLHSPRLFWQNIRTLQRGSPPVSSISQTEWFCHFRDLFYKDDIIYDAYDDTIDTDNGCNEFTDVDKFLLESPITESEIVSAVSRLKVGKSAGVDAVISEMIKTALPVIMPFLVKSYNRVFDSRCFPSEWAKSIIVPLFKNGNINNPNNYRGISLTSVVGKSFVSIINNRLTQWSNMRDLIPDAQAGFRKEHSTFDHIFTVYSVIERYLAFRKRKFYVAFVDFRKAFDSVDRDKMWKCLRNRGLKGKMFDIIRSMYSKVKSCVRCDNVLSDYFDCPTGVRQGCVLSPLLFSFFYQRTIF